MTATAIRIVLVGLAAYLLGGVPFGVIVSRWVYRVDITALGSGNTGATNVFRSLGWRPALVVALCDVGKGVLAAGVAVLAADPDWGMNGHDLLVVLAGLCAMLGHMYSPYFGLRGGKGVATAAGAILVLMPLAFPFLLVLFSATIWLSRIVSVASLLTAAAFPLVVWIAYPTRPVMLVFAAVAAPLVFFAHRANIGRLMRGEEPRTTMARSDRRADEDGTDS